MMNTEFNAIDTQVSTVVTSQVGSRDLSIYPGNPDLVTTTELASTYQISRKAVNAVLTRNGYQLLNAQHAEAVSRAVVKGGQMFWVIRSEAESTALKAQFEAARENAEKVRNRDQKPSEDAIPTQCEVMTTDLTIGFQGSNLVNTNPNQMVTFDAQSIVTGMVGLLQNQTQTLNEIRDKNENLSAQIAQLKALAPVVQMKALENNQAIESEAAKNQRLQAELLQTLASLGIQNPLGNG